MYMCIYVCMYVCVAYADGRTHLVQLPRGAANTRGERTLSGAVHRDTIGVSSVGKPHRSEARPNVSHANTGGVSSIRSNTGGVLRPHVLLGDTGGVPQVAEGPLAGITDRSEAGDKVRRRSRHGLA